MAFSMGLDNGALGVPLSATLNSETLIRRVLLFAGGIGLFCAFLPAVFLGDCVPALAGWAAPLLPRLPIEPGGLRRDI